MEKPCSTRNGLFLACDHEPNMVGIVGENLCICNSYQRARMSARASADAGRDITMSYTVQYIGVLYACGDLRSRPG